MLFGWLWLWFLALAGCAKKLPPPNTDRFPPTLLNVAVINQNRIDLTFDEPIAVQNSHPADFSIVSAAGETLGLLAIAAGPEPTGLTLLTQRQTRVRYTLQGAVQDIARNSAWFRVSFTGSLRRDTIPPAITAFVPKPFSTGLRRNIAVSFRFSKPLDTITCPEPLVLPGNLRARFQRTWNPGLTGLQFSLRDSLGPDTLVSFVLRPALSDFAGNRLRQTGYTIFAADSQLPGALHWGRLLLRDTRKGSLSGMALVIIEQPEPVSIAVGRHDGSFVFCIRDTTYSVWAVADTDLDGYTDLSCRKMHVAPGDSLVLVLEPETLRKHLDSLFQ